MRSCPHSQRAGLTGPSDANDRKGALLGCGHRRAQCACASQSRIGRMDCGPPDRLVPFDRMDGIRWGYDQCYVELRASRAVRRPLHHHLDRCDRACTSARISHFTCNVCWACSLGSVYLARTEAELALVAVRSLAVHLAKASVPSNIEQSHSCPVLIIAGDKDPITPLLGRRGSSLFRDQNRHRQWPYTKIDYLSAVRRLPSPEK